MENPQNIAHAMQRNYIFQRKGVYYPLVPVEIGKEVKGRTNDNIENLEEENHNQIIVYPNPVQNELFMDLSNELINAFYKIEIYNTVGKLVLRKTYTGGQISTIDVKELQQGIYFYSIYQNEKQILKGKFSKVFN